MNKLVIYILFACLAWTQMPAQNINTVFSTMPDKILLPLDSIQRLDLMDMYKAGQSSQMDNHLNDTCRLQSLSDEYLSLKSGNTIIELALLPMINESIVVCVITTVCAPVCDSRIEFYTTEWKQLDSDLFITLAPDKWFIKDEINKDDEVFGFAGSLLAVNLMRYQLNKDDFSLSQTYTTPEYLSPEDRKKVEPLLKNHPKKYSWNKIRFE